MVKFVKLSFLILISLLFLQNLTFGQEGVHEHDGFFLRLQAGAGSGNMTFKQDGNDDEIQFTGMAGAGALQIGGAIGENLILFGEASGVTLTDPTAKFGATEVEMDDLKVNSSTFGVGLTYYFMPSNIYLSGSLLAAMATAEFDNQKGESDTGFGFRFSAGKEWWVGNDWGIGVALYGCYSSVPEKDNDAITITTTSFGVAFSVTFN